MGLFGDLITGDWITGALSAGASAFSALSASRGQEKANAQNIALNQAQMDWQERMSNTAHQREVADLRAAGLNPILSAFGRGAQMPGGSVPNIISPTQTSSGIMANSAKSAIDNLATRASIEKIKADAALSLESAKTQQTQQALNLANANQLDRNAFGHVPFFNTPIRSLGDAIKAGYGVANDVLVASARTASEYFNKVKRTFTEGKAFRDLD